MMQQSLTRLLTLKADGFADGLDEQLTQACAASLSHEEGLSLLVYRETLFPRFVFCDGIHA
jgi:hypothetical protein